MENQPEAHPLIPEMPTATQPNDQSAPPPPPVSHVTKSKLFPLAALVGVVLLVIAAVVGFQSLRPKPTPITVTVTPTATPSPTPMRQLSGIASQPDFLTLETGVASLSAKAQSYNVNDPSLTPPELTLPLGF